MSQFYKVNEVPDEYLYDVQEYIKYSKEYDEMEVEKKLNGRGMIFRKKTFPEMFGYFFIEHIRKEGQDDNIYGKHFIEITRWTPKYGFAQKI